MNTFFRKMLFVFLIALLIGIGSLLSNNGSIQMALFVIVLLSPIAFVVGLIVAIIGKSGSSARETGQAIMLASAIILVVGFVACSSIGFKL